MSLKITSTLFVTMFVASFMVQAAATGTSQTNTDTLPVKHPAKIFPGNTVCPSTEEREVSFAEVNQEINTLIRNTILPLFCPGNNPQNPAASCLKVAECDPGLPSGYYWINATTQVYCDMDRQGCSDGTGGWTRVAFLNMTDPVQQCPTAWREITSPIRTCGRSTGNDCDSAIFTTTGIQYSNILGRIVGYQYGNVDAFGLSAGDSLDGHYMDGVSITHGMPRKHIWSFTADSSEQYVRCPCSSSVTIPSFVGEDYFCESGNAGSSTDYVLYEDDPLWDGQGCGISTCCTYNNPPWFCQQLLQASTDDIEIRICNSGHYTTEETPIELIEIYIQ